MRRYSITLALATILALTAGWVVQAAPLMIVGNDEKLLWDDNGKPLLSAPGKDSVLIVDLANPLERRSSPIFRSRTRSSVRRSISRSIRPVRWRSSPIRST
jgi:hypothetical protein